MKELKTTIVLFAFLLGCGLNAQNSSNAGFSNIPKESVYLQHNESLVFSGENLLYKLYCLDKATKELSNISKIAYVTLIDMDGEPVFSHKIHLTDGTGYGDFFVPTSVPTGSYKLLGYSEWMENFGKEQFFQSDIFIINPYQPTPASYLKQPLDSAQLASGLVEEEPQISFGPLQKGSIHVSMNLDKATVGTREKVTLAIEGKNQAASSGSYSVSIRRVDSLPSPAQMTSETFVGNFINSGSANGTLGANLKIPELRGELISGVITAKDTGLPVENQKISLSFPGDNYLFKVATSNEEGRFRFVIGREYDNTSAALQVLADDWDSYEVTLDSKEFDYNGFQFSNFELSEAMNDRILKKSIQNQIENAYREVKLDSIIPASHVAPFYRNFTETYDLDDYTRFNSIQETIIEVVDQVSIRRLDNGNRVFEVRPAEGYTDNALLPMLFVDGLFIKKHEDFMSFSAKKIKSISFSREKVLLGSQMFQGVIDVKTIEGDFYSDFYTPHIVNVDLFRPESQKQYYNQIHTEGQGQGRIPDFRYQLFWEPNLDLSEGNKEVIFYTSDVPGIYELVLEGFTSTGNPVSVKEKLVVQ